MLQSNNQYDIIYSNIDHIDKLLTDGITPDNISESALKSYYVHTYFVQIQNGGFSQLDKIVDKSNTILYYIRNGLASIKATRNMKLFDQYIVVKKRQETQNYKIFDKLFNHINKQENILQLNTNWLKSNQKLSTINMLYIKNLKKNHEKVNIEILKKLCKIANEEYLRITSYDRNNLYTDSCHFKTLHSYFYMIKEGNKYVMYNSFTKKEVSSLRVKKAEKNSFFSGLWGGK